MDAPETIELRPVGDADADFLLRVYGETRAGELAAVPWTDAEKDGFVRQQFAAQHHDYTSRFPAAQHSVVVADGEAVGRIWIDRRPEEIRLLDIALLAEHRNRGIGGVLLGRLQDEARRAGKPLRHSVEKSNGDGLRFYRRLGFQVVEDWGLHDLMEWLPPGSATGEIG